MRKIAHDRDQAVIEARKAEAEQAAALAAPIDDVMELVEDDLGLVDTPESRD